MSEVVVSVVMATYNYSCYIGEAIDSVFNSDFPSGGIEIIIIDDGSSDDTPERIKEYLNRVTYIYQENQGKAHATQRAIDLAQGKYIFNLDADDWFAPQKIQKVVDIFESDPEIVHVGHSWINRYMDSRVDSTSNIVDEIANRKILGTDLITYFYRKKVCFGGGSAFAARAEVLKTQRIPPEVDMYIDEYLILAALSHGGSSYLLDEPLYFWRIHNQNFSRAQSSRRKKFERSIKSIESIDTHIQTLGFNDEILSLYRLKFMTFKLFFKEDLGEKSGRDIAKMWLHFLKSIPLFGIHTIEIFKNYNILTRSLPGMIVKRLKEISIVKNLV
jgi:glycosyltransferase involved in cell wall biosynthesis